MSPKLLSVPYSPLSWPRADCRILFSLLLLLKHPVQLILPSFLPPSLLFTFPHLILAALFAPHYKRKPHFAQFSRGSQHLQPAHFPGCQRPHHAHCRGVCLRQSSSLKALLSLDLLGFTGQREHFMQRWAQ